MEDGVKVYIKRYFLVDTKEKNSNMIIVAALGLLSLLHFYGNFLCHSHAQNFKQDNAIIKRFGKTHAAANVCLCKKQSL